MRKGAEEFKTSVSSESPGTGGKVIVPTRLNLHDLHPPLHRSTSVLSHSDLRACRIIMFNPNSLLPTMPPPGTPLPQPSQQAAPVPLPKFTDHRRTIHIPDDYPVTIPTKRINDEATKTFWSKSEAFIRYLEFIQVLNEAVKNKKNSDGCVVSEVRSPFESGNPPNINIY